MIKTQKLLPLLGILGGAFWISLAFFPPVCAPVIESSEVFCNRLWTPALLGMLMGFSGLFRLLRPSFTKTARGGFMALLAGFALMVIGNFTEYWLLSNLPHQGPEGFIRGIAWMTFLFGTLLLLIASTVVGFALTRTVGTPRWLRWLFVLPLPLTVAIGFVNMSWAGIPIGSLSVVVGGLGLLPGAASSAQAGKA